MFLSDFDFELPPDLIAQYPPARRRDSRLLVVGKSLDDRQFSDLPALLHDGDLLVFNDTRVIRARLHGHKQTGGQVEVLVERVLPNKEMLAQVRASKTPKPGTILKLPAVVMPPLSAVKTICSGYASRLPCSSFWSNMVTCRCPIPQSRL